MFLLSQYIESILINDLNVGAIIAIAVFLSQHLILVLRELVLVGAGTAGHLKVPIRPLILTWRCLQLVLVDLIV